MEPVIFTDAAAAHIAKMLEKTPGAVGFRLSIKKTGCSGFAYVPEIIEKTKSGDIHYSAQNNLQIYIDPDLSQYVEALKVDFISEEGQGLKQKRLVFINPKESGRCGCGESFTIE